MAKKVSRKRGTHRPGKYSQAIAHRICERLAAGESLRAICRDKDFPPESTVRGWVLDLPDFAAQYARARDLGCDARADEILEIADTPVLARKRKETTVGEEWFCKACDRPCVAEWICPACGQKAGWDSILWIHLADKSPLCEGVAKAERRWQHDDRTPLCEQVEKPTRRPIVEVEITQGDAVDRAKLQVDSRKWHLSKIAPKKYGTARSEVKNLYEIDWDNAPPELLDKVADHLLKLVVGDDPDAVGAMRKRIEAGQLVEVRAEVVEE